MYKITTILLLLTYNYFCCVAQNKPENDRDRVYLRNGRIIDGLVVEDADNSKYIRIRVEKNGKDSIYVFKKEEVELVKRQQAGNSIKKRGKQPESSNIINSNTIKTTSSPDYKPQNHDYDITNPIKETIKQSRIEQPAQQEIPTPVSNNEFVQGLKSGDVAGEDTYLYSLPPLRARRAWHRDISGFRAFMDQVGTLGLGNNANHRYAFAGSVGIQFNPIFYLGVGFECSLSLNNKQSSLPAFINSRINFLDNNTTPFLDLRSGWSLIEGKGFYSSATTGVSFSKGTSAWNIGLGYSFQRVKYKYRPDETKIETINAFEEYHGLFLRLTFEFNIYRF